MNLNAKSHQSTSVRPTFGIFYRVYPLESCRFDDGHNAHSPLLLGHRLSHKSDGREESLGALCEWSFADADALKCLHGKFW